MPAKVGLVPIVASALAAGFVAGAPLAGAQEAPTAATATIDKVGWWNVSRGPQAGEPDNPVRPALAPVPAPPTNVPADAVGVGAALGEPTKVAAVGIVLDGATGGTVDALTLTLKESPAPGAGIGTDAAAIVACPITAFWGETRNGNWIDRPTADCTLAESAGTRGADGTWTFDLASIASAAGWLDPSSSIGQNGVLLVEKVDAPTGFEASFPDPAAGGMTLQFAASGAGAAADPFAAGDGAGAAADALVPGGPEGETSPPGDLGRADPFSPSPAPVAPGVASRPSPATDGAGDARGTAGRPSAAAARAGDLVGNLSPATYLLIPAALLGALALSLYLGASRAPATPALTAGGAATPSGPGRRRAGGVSRALARRERAASNAAPARPRLEHS